MSNNNNNNNNSVKNNLESKSLFLCACGKSKNFPFCDGSHSGLNWKCESDSDWNKIGFLSSIKYQNLATKLASHYKGILRVPTYNTIKKIMKEKEEEKEEKEEEEIQKSKKIEVIDLIIICDGIDLEFITYVYNNQEIISKEIMVICMDTTAKTLHKIFNKKKTKIFDLSKLKYDFFNCFEVILSIIDYKDYHKCEDGICIAELKKKLRNIDDDIDINEVINEVGPLNLKNCFLSHAVKDEKIILPVVDLLRDYYDADLFLCADSIPAGSNWYRKIIKNLKKKEVFIVLLSESVSFSKFCAFEIGMAYALQKTIHIISIDGSFPPSYIQHLNMLDIKRIQEAKPWLKTEDILTESILKIISSPYSPSSSSNDDHINQKTIDKLYLPSSSSSSSSPSSGQYLHNNMTNDNQSNPIHSNQFIIMLCYIVINIFLFYYFS